MTAATRQLAAIIFADMVGYTALMQQNESLALTKRERFKNVLTQTVEDSHGTILQFYGDGMLAIFKSALDGVNCAVSIQQQLQSQSKVDVRIGIHLGDVMLDEDSVYGDGVNLASRIETLAVSGSVFISEKVYDEIKNHENILTRSMGYFELKNVKQPVQIFSIINEGLVVPQRDELKGKTKEPTNKLAVLPFVNMSNDAENEYFSDGITEELINALSRVEGLQVTARTSCFAFKGKNEDIRDIGIKLNVDKILEGSVRKSGSKLRIVAQLVNAADGYHLWSETYNRDMIDIFELQDEISRTIANKLREKLNDKDAIQNLVKAPTTNLEAYNVFLKGLYYWKKNTPDDARKTIQYMNEAIEIEPNFAVAHSIASAAYSFLGATGHFNPQEAIRLTEQHALKAIEIDSSLPYAYIALGMMKLFRDADFKGAYEELSIARQKNPGASEVHTCLALYHSFSGNIGAFVEEATLANQLDPMSMVTITALGDAYLNAERYEEAIKQYQKALELEPNSRRGLEGIGLCYAMMGSYDKAIEILEEVYRLTGHPLKGLSALGFAYGRAGQMDKAMDCVRKLEQRAIDEPNIPMDIDLCFVWAGIGDADKFFHHINQMIEKKQGMGGLINEVYFKHFRSDLRFLEIKKRLNIPD